MLVLAAAPGDARPRDAAPVAAVQQAPFQVAVRSEATDTAVAAPADTSSADVAETDGAAVDAPDIPMWTAAPAAASTEINRFASRLITRTSSIALSLTRNAMRFIGTPYVWGGTSPRGFDCSGYTQHVFSMLGIHLPRTADAQFYAGRRITDRLVVGDLVFFETYSPGPSHVGIYVGDGKFIHSARLGVQISKLSERYWARHYLGAKRFLAQG
jgi:cell wall-associated NlpC family hydrolase